MLSRLQPLAKLSKNPSLRRTGIGFALFNAAEYGEWIAVLVYAYAHGGASTTGVLAFAQLAPCVILAPILATFADRYQPGRVLVWGYAAQAVGMGMLAAALIAERAASGRVRVCDPGSARVQRHPSDRKRAAARGRAHTGRADRRKRRSGMDRERRCRCRAVDRGRGDHVRRPGDGGGDVRVRYGCRGVGRAAAHPQPADVRSCRAGLTARGSR